MAQRQVKRIRRTARALRSEKIELEQQSARVGVDTRWTWAVLRPAIPYLRMVMPDRCVLWLANRAAARFRWRLDGGDWRPFDPPRFFTLADL